MKTPIKSDTKRGAVDQPRLVLRWGVFCEAALKHNPRALPRYTATTKAEAIRIAKQADRECQSRAKHPVKLLPPNTEMTSTPTNHTKP